MSGRIDRLIAPAAPTPAPKQLLGSTKPHSKRTLRIADKVDAHKLPPKPDEMSWRDYLVLLLHIAAELEHGLMVEYLYAAYTLGGSGVGPKYEKRVREWHDVILTVAREEMGHLITVQNLLVLIGGPVNFDRHDFPWSSPFYPFEFNLKPLTLKTLAQFVYAEMPRQLTAEQDAEARRAAMKLVDTSRPTVGEIYDQIIEIIASEKHIPDDTFDPTSYPHQSTWDEWGRGYHPGTHRPYAPPEELKVPPKNERKTRVLVEQMATRTEALAALREVAGQGEAEDLKVDKREPSHFDRFAEIFRSYENILKKAPRFRPYQRVPRNPSAGHEAKAPPGTTPITDEASLKWAGIFNIRYRILLSLLTYTYRIPRDAPQSFKSRRPAMLSRIFSEMYNLKAISAILVRMPLSNKPGDTRRAAPPFQMPYTLSPPLPERNFWKMHRELLDASSALAAALLTPHLANRGPQDGVNYLRALCQADGDTVVWINEILAGIEASRRAHV